jgi:hypothetical protein
MPTNTLQDWFATPLGQYLLEKEQAYLDDVTPDIFGFHAMQLGMPEVDLLRESRIAHRVRIGRLGIPTSTRKCHELPLATQSIDWCCCRTCSSSPTSRTRSCARSTA